MNSIRSILIAVLITAGLGSVAVATEEAEDEWSEYDLTETWLCFDRYEGTKRRPTIVLTRYKMKDGEFEMGEVKVAGAVHLSTFSVAGVNRRWNFGESYAFLIHPDGSGLYYDFSFVEDGETTGANQSFKCVLK